MTSIDRLKENLLLLIIPLIFFIGVLTVLIRTVSTPKFVFQNYSLYQEDFDTKYNNKNNKDKIKIFNQEFLGYDINKVIEEYNNLDMKTNIKTDFVLSSNEQVKQMALNAVEEGKKYLKQDNVKFINSVYLPRQEYSAILGKPTEYLFFLTTEEKKNVIAVIFYQTKDGIKSRLVWQPDKSGDADYVEKEKQKLLIVYNLAMK